MNHMKSQLKIQAHTWSVEDVALSLRGLWDRSPTWTLSGAVVRPHNKTASFHIEGQLTLERSRPRLPEDLRGAAWWSSGDQSISILGGMKPFVVDGREVTVGFHWNRETDRPDPLRVSISVQDGGRARVEVKGLCEWSAVPEHGDLELESTTVAGLSLIAEASMLSMGAFHDAPALIWPMSSAAAFVERLDDLKACFASDVSPELITHDYLTGSEGAGSGSITTCPAARREDDLVSSAMRLMRACTDNSCKGWLPVERGGQVPWESAWRELERALILADLGGRPVAGALAMIDPAEAEERVRWIENVLTRKFAKKTPNPNLRVAVNRALLPEGENSHQRPWPVAGAVQQAVSFCDEWNHKQLVVRTSTQDALVIWRTSA